MHSLKPFASCLSVYVQLMLIKTLAFPHFNYCDVIINDMAVEPLDRLQYAQNHCLQNCCAVCEYRSGSKVILEPLSTSFIILLWSHEYQAFSAEAYYNHVN